MKQIDRINGFVNKYLTLFVLAVVALALIAPNLLAPIGQTSLGKLAFGTRSFNFSLTSVMLMIIMFGAGTSISAKEILQVVKKPLHLSIAVVAKYLIMALTAFLVAKLLRLNDQLAFGLILLGTMPPGTAAAVLVALAGGEIPFGVAICVICTLLAPIASPALTMLLGGAWVSVDFLSMVISITIVVLIPMVLGIVVKSIFQEKIQNFKRILTSFCLLSVLIIIGTSTAPNRDVILSMDSVIVMVAITLNFALAAVCCWLLTRLLKMDRPRTNATILTSCEQNNALAVGIAAGFSTVSPAVAIPSIVAVALNFVLATILTNILSTKRGKEDTPSAA